MRQLCMAACVFALAHFGFSAGEKRTVVVQFTLDADGTVIDPKVTASDEPLLNPYAIAMVRQKTWDAAVLPAEDEAPKLIESPLSFPVDEYEGNVPLPVGATSSACRPLVIACQPAPVRRRMVEESARLAPEQASFEALDAELDRIRTQGSRVSESRDVVGVTDIGVPLLGPDGHAVASIVVPHLRRHGTAAPVAAILAALERAGGAISAQLI